ncbi:alpha/beta hydrolase [Pseudomonas sp. Hp2]|uniref:alpha/beta hydrolase n=1 Tax=Pseudomonas sp. Hp2 TaxID=701189 RepID=UPI00112E22E4|nr:alpha/beta hydrolase [Pseudomonas sp. Hp2]
MSKKIRLVLALLVVVAFVGHRYWKAHAPPPTAKPAADAAGAAAGQAARRHGALEFQPCTLTHPQAPGNVEAKCATLQVPENPAAPQGRRIALKIAWLEADSDGPGEADPVFFIAGGPGQSATESASLVAPALAEVRKKRDIFLVDQRGTGGSNALACTGADGKPLSPPDEEDASAEAVADYARRCAASLQGRADPRFYTTTEAVGDLDAVRQAIGAETIDLIGVSYGTRVVQHYAAAHPRHTRAIVIDGVAPNDLVVGGEFATTFEDAIRLQAEQCRTDPACAKRFPTDTREQLRNVMARLRQAPVDVEYRNPGTGEIERGKVTADTVTGLAFAFSYAPQTASLLPLILDEAAQGRYGPLMSLAGLASRQFGDTMNRAMQWSVICAEDADRYRAPEGAQQTLFGPDVAKMFFAACPAWPTGTRPAGFTEPLRSDVPALLLSGELDPVTPPRYAERVLEGLPNGRHLVAPGQGHNVMALGCIPKLIGQFIDQADAKSLDAQCVGTLSRVPAFTSFNGWEP